jgi:hypothetical protein
MAKGFDTSTPLTLAKAQQFAADGYLFVARYLAPLSWNSRKGIKRQEAEWNTQAGLNIVSAWETTAGAAGEGMSAGKEAGIFALQSAQEVGQPEGTKIYAAVDFEASKSQYEKIADYFKAMDEQIVGYEIDAYGNDRIIEFLRDRGIIRNGWQTIAWSGGRIAEGISIYQNNCGPTGLGYQKFGIGIDDDISHGNEGWWNTNMAVIPQLPNSDGFDQDAAQKVINDLSALYMASKDEAVQEACRFAAKSLRIAKNIPEE